MVMIGSVDGHQLPLLFEPGEGWAYGAGIDWAGKLVEKVNGGMRLGDYMKKNFWEPLGMNSTTFNIDSDPNVRSRLADMTMRMPTGELIDVPDAIYPRPAPDDCGGVGGYSTAPDYIKVLISILENDGKLLKSSSIDQLFKPQLPDRKYLAKILDDPVWRAGLAGPLPASVQVDYGLGGMVNLDPVSGGRAAGSMQWGGLPNLFWWIDRTNAVAACYFTQLLPTGDPALLEMMREIEQAVYSDVDETKSRS